MEAAYFLSFNCIFPLFNRGIFDSRFERQYSDNRPKEIAWYACFNMVMAIGSAILTTCYPMTDPTVPVQYVAEALDSPDDRLLMISHFLPSSTGY